MSFRIWKKPSTPVPRVEPGAVAPSLPPDVVAAGARRLVTMAMIIVVTTVIFAVLDYTFDTARGSLSSQIRFWASVVSIGISLAVAWAAARQMLAPESLLDLGIAYEIVTVFLIGLQFYSTPIAESATPRGFSGVAVTLLVFPLLVPNTYRKMAFGAIVSGLMDPVSFLIMQRAVGHSTAPTSTAFRFIPTLISVVVAIVVSRIIYNLSIQAGRGSEMGSYNLEERLGRGGMGEVWRASHKLLARQAAIKLIRPDALGGDSRELSRRFEREARATAALRSPHTVDVYDFGTTEDGTFYYVMELLDGYDGETLVDRFGPLPPERTVFLLTQACHSLAEAHEGGMIHRDIKPANLYSCRYGLDFDFVKVLDFGLVKVPDQPRPGERQLTVAGLIAGTPGYIAPEIALGNPDVDWRSDIYALGCVAYWLLTGKVPLEGKTPMQTVLDHTNKPATAPSLESPGIPKELDEIVLACMQKDPNNRPQTMRELAQRLETVKFAPGWSPERARRWWLEHPPVPGARGNAAVSSADPTASSDVSPVRAAR
jgi:serine/threonine-protein kinase